MARIRSISSVLRCGGMVALLGGLLLPGLAQRNAAPTETSPTLPAYTTPAPVAGVPGLYPVSYAGSPVVPFTMKGSWARVNEGKASPWDYFQADTRTMTAALGVGTLKEYRCTGDMLSFAGRTFIRTTHPRNGVQLIETAAPFRSPSLMGVPALAQGIIPRSYRLRCEQPMLLQSMLEALANNAKCPIGVLGWVSMPELRALGLKKAPIDNMPLFGDRQRECLETVDKADAGVVFFAVVSPATTPRPSLNAAMIAKYAYAQPPVAGEAPTARINVMAAVVEQPIPVDYFTRPAVIDDLRAVTVKDVVRVQGHSLVQKGTLFVYRLDYLQSK